MDMKISKKAINAVFAGYFAALFLIILLSAVDADLATLLMKVWGIAFAIIFVPIYLYLLIKWRI